MSALGTVCFRFLVLEFQASCCAHQALCRLVVIWTLILLLAQLAHNH